MTAIAAELTAPTDRRRRPPRLLLCLLVGGLGVALVVGVTLWRQRGPGSAPYQDASAQARLTLCDASGRPLTSGSVSDRFAAVVGRTPVDPAAGPGATATLFAYQPRQGVGASEWTGLPLTAPGGTAAATPLLTVGGDAVTLAQFLRGYPATWDGWVQLRLVVSSPATGTSPTYDSADLRVEGGRWRAVDPGTATCPS